MHQNTIETFGKMPDGRLVKKYTIANKNAICLEAINYGAAICSLKVPMADGKLLDVVLGFDKLQSYLNSYEIEGAPYLGAIVGRYAGRIDKGRFPLNGKIVQLNCNLGKHTHHGGVSNFSKAYWDAEQIKETSTIVFKYKSRDGEENYPGDLDCLVKYSLTEQNELIYECTAKSSKDTIANIVQHSYFNLEGHQADVSGQDLHINSDRMLETNDELIANGNILNISSTEFDYNAPKKCPARIDNTFVVKDNNIVAASLFSKKTGLKMDVFTNQPAVHIYIGGNCQDIKGKEEVSYHSLSGICFETQNFPDAPNHPSFPNPFLRKGESYYHKTTYKFSFII
jgi:aldose 1-epimerase